MNDKERIDALEKKVAELERRLNGRGGPMTYSYPPADALPYYVNHGGIPIDEQVKQFFRGDGWKP